VYNLQQEASVFATHEPETWLKYIAVEQLASRQYSRQNAGPIETHFLYARQSPARASFCLSTLFCRRVEHLICPCSVGFEHFRALEQTKSAVAALFKKYAVLNWQPFFVAVLN
jgi:hypothetical protein